MFDTFKLMLLLDYLGWQHLTTSDSGGIELYPQAVCDDYFIVIEDEVLSLYSIDENWVMRHVKGAHFDDKLGMLATLITAQYAAFQITKQYDDLDDEPFATFEGGNLLFLNTIGSNRISLDEKHFINFIVGKSEIKANIGINDIPFSFCNYRDLYRIRNSVNSVKAKISQLAMHIKYI